MIQVDPRKTSHVLALKPGAKEMGLYIYIYWLVVYLPPWKIWKSDCFIIPTIGENKKMFQTTNQYSIVTPKNMIENWDTRIFFRKWYVLNIIYNQLGNTAFYLCRWLDDSRCQMMVGMMIDVSIQDSASSYTLSVGPVGVLKNPQLIPTKTKLS